jgi:hypothetical protein
MNEKIANLDEMIVKMRFKFSQFEYVNILDSNSYDYNLGGNTYAIVVRGVRQNIVKEFLQFVEEEILSPLAETDDELPLIITLENCTFKDIWKWSVQCRSSFPVTDFTFNIAESRAAEDYSFALAA